MLELEPPIRKFDAHVGGFEPDLGQMSVDLVNVGQMKNNCFESQNSIELLSYSLLPFLLDIGFNDFLSALSEIIPLVDFCPRPFYGTKREPSPAMSKFGQH